MTTFETIGRSEKSLMTKLRGNFDRVSTVTSTIQGFSDIAAYTAVESRLFQAIREGNLEETRMIVTEYNIRRLQMGISLNHESSSEDLRLIGPQFSWSPVLHMIENQ